MSRVCFECGRDALRIIGLGSYEDTIIVECLECGASFELDQDGLNEGGMEMVEAFEIEQQLRTKENANAWT